MDAFPRSQAPSRSPRAVALFASGVMSLVSAGAVGAGGVFLMLLGVVARSEDHETEGGDSILGLAPVVGIVFFLAAAVYLTCGLGCVRTRTWGRILTIVVQGLALALIVLGIVNDSTGAGWPYALVAWSGVILGLAIAGQPGTLNHPRSGRGVPNGATNPSAVGLRTTGVQ